LSTLGKGFLKILDLISSVIEPVMLPWPAAHQFPVHVGIQAGDSVFFSVEGEKAVLKPFTKHSLLDFYGSLPVKRKYPGSDAVRREVHQKISNAIAETTWISPMPY
jgi:hypothetical protein